MKTCFVLCEQKLPVWQALKTPEKHVARPVAETVFEVVAK
jgi:hypothetical protein